MARGRAALALVLTAGLAAGCASSRPVLYPNAKLESVGRETAEIDVSACMRQAEQQGLERNRESDLVFERYVELCLRERGYQTIGWK